MEQAERHGGCHRQPYARELEHTHGVHRFRLECSGWHATGKRTAGETEADRAGGRSYPFALIGTNRQCLPIPS
ncbi:hypothetical protein EKH77_27015 [Streptomyces luteoverticillatus]|uniref:Uncharacterized protein n=1 Tax=Streptomyces luteoverticillatus TaxID=66425 RepID=A0A3Q9FZX9_STRLT|nr:hypothetical protein EKH77_27015 [Streptomyces luteoverticillatus]